MTDLDDLLAATPPSGLNEAEWRIMFAGPAWTQEVDDAMSADDFRKALEIHRRNTLREMFGEATVEGSK